MKKELLCTLGPASMNDRIIMRLEEIGVSLFRINLSHTPLSKVSSSIQFIQDRSSVPVCLDTEGAQIRTGEFSKAPVELIENSFVDICLDEVDGNSGRFNFTPHNIVDELQVDDFVSIDFNSVLAQVVEKRTDGISLRIVNGGSVGRNKAVTVERSIPMPPLSEKDRKAVLIGRELGVRHFALSFAGAAEEVDMLRDLAGDDAVIISKIESRRALVNLEQISQASDAILIDRGDLSREIPIERIPATQKLIADQAKRSKVKLYVATNLLESMIESPVPTRAEVNDIYNTLVDGADGLVLAAETAIGKYPLQCANMIVRLVDEYSKGDGKGDELFYSLPSQSQLIAPHGGELVHRDALSDDLSNLNGLKRISVDMDSLSDCQLVATGVYSPITGFMDRDELSNVLNKNKLSDGTVWTMPIVLPVPRDVANSVSMGERIVLRSEGGQDHVLLDITDIYPIDFDDVTEKWFGTTSHDHPGVKRLSKMGTHCISGPIKLISKLSHDHARYELTPQQCRFVFTHKGWQHVVGFHTRNIAHRAHEYIQLQALDITHADGLFINPVLGGKKSGDFLSDPIMKSYQLLLDGGVFPKGQVVLGSFSTYSRYCGPREAVFTALCRKNMGCNYFIVGRDHAGVGNFYGPDDNRRLFDEVGDIGISPVFFDTIGYDSASGEYRPVDSSGKIENISGTEFRKALLNHETVPEWFIRKPIQEMLLSELSANRDIFHA